MRRGRRALKRRGVVGIESAIVLIAFVIVAAALAFVVLNMGFFTTQKSKETIRSGLGEASSALELDGSIVAHVDVTNKKVTYWYAPLKLAAGEHPVDLTVGKATIAYWSPQRGISYTDIYALALSDTEYKSVSDVMSNSDVQAKLETQTVDNQTVFTGYAKNETFAVIAWVTNINQDNVLDPGEKAMLIIFYTSSDAPESYDVVKAEVKVPVGAPLTIERSIPPSLTQEIIDLG